MARRSPLYQHRADSIVVCGKILRAGQVLTVSESAIGPRERELAERGTLVIRASNQPGKLQVVCNLG